ncbi:MAG: DivIVA domain-containing protein [Actinomycetota bacterium]
MNLNPTDVEQKAFTQALRGYQMDEVDDFLDEVVNTLRSHEQRLREAQEKIRALESQPMSIGGDESEISRAILTAQRSADRIVAEARTEAEAIRSQAKEEAGRLTAERDAERTGLLGEISNMRGLVGGLRGRLAELTGKIGVNVDQMDQDLADTEAGVRSEPRQAAHAAPMVVPPPAPEPEAVEQEEPAPPSFSDIFPSQDDEKSMDGSGGTIATEAKDAASRLTSRPWERD